MISGELRGYLKAHQKYGKLPWASLFQPSIQLARDGFPVTNTMESRIEEDKETILNTPAFRDVFAPGGALLKRGMVVKRVKFAETLDVLARDPESFYTVRYAEGNVARRGTTRHEYVLLTILRRAPSHDLWCRPFRKPVAF